MLVLLFVVLYIGLMAEITVDGGHGGGNHPLHWTSPMSGFMLRRFVELIAGGVKTEKDFLRRCT